MLHFYSYPPARPMQPFAGLLVLESAIKSLDVFPHRYTVAAENELYANVTVRQMPYGRGQSIYRILYCVFEEDHEVRILNVRHGARRRMTESEDES